MEAATPPPPPPPDETGVVPDPATQPADPPADPPPPPPAQEPAAGRSDEREYTVFTERKLNLKTAADRKTAMDDLQALSEITDGKLTILVQLGRAPAPDPRKAIIKLGQARDIDDDVEVIASGARNKYANVKTATKRDVSIG